MQNFDDWMDKVDALLIEECLMSSADLPDYAWRYDFEEGLTPEEATAKYVAEEFS